MTHALVLLAATLQLTDITAESGLDFRHDPGADGGYQLPEITGSGAALLDFDNDGDLDAYLVQATGENRLFEQRERGRFVDVSERAGAADDGYGMGVAVGDVDNDGDVDLFVTNDGPDRLYRNDGGRFVDVTEAFGITGDFWSASATFCDYDADGFLDLYVTHYVAYDREKACSQSDGSKDYCSPQVFPGTPDKLYRNDGGRRFVDQSARAGSGTRARPVWACCAPT